MITYLAQYLYFQTGSVIGRSYTQDGDYNQAKTPIRELQSSSGAAKAQMLISNYNHYLNQIRTVTGLNEARDGSMPDPNSLVGVQKLAALNSNCTFNLYIEFILGSPSVYVLGKVST